MLVQEKAREKGIQINNKVGKESTPAVFVRFEEIPREKEGLEQEGETKHFIGVEGNEFRVSRTFLEDEGGIQS